MHTQAKPAFLHALVLVHLLAFLPAQAADPRDSLDARLARLPRPWTQPIHSLTYEEYEATLKYWTEQFPRLITLERRGQSHDGLGVYLLKVTDSSVPDNDKQVALVSALHGGPERSGCTTALRLVEWLVGDSALARETRRKQIVLVMPIPNPHAFFVVDKWGNKEGVDLYDPQLKWWDLGDGKAIKLAHPDKTPELAAFLSVVDQYRPEVHMDLHGTGLQGFTQAELANRTMYQGQTMFEVSACSYSNCAVRPWDWRVTEAMVRAGQEAGFGSDRVEADAQRTHWTADNDRMKDRLWIAPRTDRFRTPFYGYMKYHTMISTTEIGWEESGVARVSGILALGNKPWLDEKFSGYPVTRVKARTGRYITAYGETAEQRRASRVELWQLQSRFSDAILYPEYDGRLNYTCAVTEAGSSVLNRDLNTFADNLKQLPNVDADAVKKFIRIGPELRLSAGEKKATAGRIQNGIGFRLRIPYRSPEVLDVSLNGHSLPESATDGYQAWYADGYTHVQVNIPPVKTRTMDLYVVTCAYTGDQRRSYGFTPPDAVLKQLAAKK